MSLLQTRRRLLASAMVLAALPAYAAAPRPYDQAAFDAAQSDGKPILVQISAPWCPICKAQKPIIAKLATDRRFAEMTVFEIDFDSERNLVRRFDARSQSTLILYRGKTEVGRSVGETQPEWIEAFLEKAL